MYGYMYMKDVLFHSLLIQSFCAAPSIRSRLQGAVPSLRTIDDQCIGSSSSPPAGCHDCVAPGSFAALCQAQLQQTGQLQERHSRRLR